VFTAFLLLLSLQWHDRREIGSRNATLVVQYVLVFLLTLPTLYAVQDLCNGRASVSVRPSVYPINRQQQQRTATLLLISSVFTCTGALGTPSRTGPLARKYLPGFL